MKTLAAKDDAFAINMQRVAALTKIAHSDHEAIEKAKVFAFKGLAADLRRATVVFLHATFEGLLRAIIPNPRGFSFSGAGDISKALAKANINRQPFEHLYPPLSQLALRRHKIVHRADLSANGELVPWDFSDTWQLIMWNLAVICFNAQLQVETGDETTVFVSTKAVAKYKRVMEAHVQYAHQFMSLPRVPKEPQKLIDALGALSKSGESMLQSLEWDLDALIEEAKQINLLTEESP